MPQFRHVSRACLRRLRALNVYPAQRDFVASIAVAIVQPAYQPGSAIQGIWDRETPAGLILTINFGLPEARPTRDSGMDTDIFYLWRLMIDAAHQGKGHGQAALRHFVALARASGQRRAVLCVVVAPGSALPLDEKHGFRRTGHVVHDEVIMARAL